MPKKKSLLFCTISSPWKMHLFLLKYWPPFKVLLNVSHEIFPDCPRRSNSLSLKPSWHFSYFHVALPAFNMYYVCVHVFFLHITVWNSIVIGLRACKSFSWNQSESWVWDTVNALKLRDLAKVCTRCIETTGSTAYPGLRKTELLPLPPHFRTQGKGMGFGRTGLRGEGSPERCYVL